MNPNLLRRIAVAALPAVIVAGVGTALAQTDAAAPLAAKTADAGVTLQLDGIAGDIDVSSFDVSAKNSASSGGAGKVDFDVKFGKVVDPSTPLLVKDVATGVHLKSALFTFRRPGKNGAVFETYKLEDVTVAGYEQGPDQPTAERVELSFSRITVTETPANGAPVVFGWDTTANAPI